MLSEYFKKQQPSQPLWEQSGLDFAQEVEINVSYFILLQGLHPEDLRGPGRCFLWKPPASLGTGRISRLRGLAKALGLRRFQWRVQRRASCQVQSQPCVRVPINAAPCRGIKGPELFLKHGFLSVSSYLIPWETTRVEGVGTICLWALSRECWGPRTAHLSPLPTLQGPVLPKHFGYVMAGAPRPRLPSAATLSPSEHHDQEAASSPPT